MGTPKIESCWGYAITSIKVPFCFRTKSKSHTNTVTSYPRCLPIFNNNTCLASQLVQEWRVSVTGNKPCDQHTLQNLEHSTLTKLLGISPCSPIAFSAINQPSSRLDSNTVRTSRCLKDKSPSSCPSNLLRASTSYKAYRGNLLIVQLTSASACLPHDFQCCSDLHPRHKE